MLGGGCAGTYFYFGKPAEASAPKSEDSEGHAEDTHKESKAKDKKDKHAKKDDGDHGGGDDGHGGGHELNYVDMHSIILPIVDKSGVSQTVSMSLSLEAKSLWAADNVRAMSPKLKDAYIQDIYGVLSRHAALKGGVIQIDLIKERLKRVSKRVMGDDSIVDVMIQVVQQRPV